MPPDFTVAPITCAFCSGPIGSHTNTGDGYLMGAEAWAKLSGMEFSTIYTLSPARCPPAPSLTHLSTVPGKLGLGSAGAKENQQQSVDNAEAPPRTFNPERTGGFLGHRFF